MKQQNKRQRHGQREVMLTELAFSTNNRCRGLESQTQLYFNASSAKTSTIQVKKKQIKNLRTCPTVHRQKILTFTWSSLIVTVAGPNIYEILTTLAIADSGKPHILFIILGQLRSCWFEHVLGDEAQAFITWLSSVLQGTWCMDLFRFQSIYFVTKFLPTSVLTKGKVNLIFFVACNYDA